MVSAVCRVLLYSSLAYSTFNEITVEIATPPITAPNGMLMCFTTPGIYLSEGNFTVRNLVEGGTQFSTAGQSSFNGIRGSFYAAAARLGHDPLEFGTVRDVLGTDGYYASSYSRSRYDDFVADGAGHSLAGVVAPEEPPWAVPLGVAEVPAAEVAEHTNFLNGFGSLVPGGFNMERLRVAGRRSGNCVLVTGNWNAATRYQVTLGGMNPPPPASRTAWAAEAAAGGPSPEPLGLWVAPLTYSGTADKATLRYTVRGDKYGAVCPPRSGIASTMYDACAAAASTQPPIAPGVAGQAPSCKSALEACLLNPAPGAGCPSNLTGLPDVSTPTLIDLGVATCPSGQARSSRFGGECVACSPLGTVGAAGGTCTCDAGAAAVPAGTRACTPTSELGGTRAEVLTKLCDEFAKEKDQLLAGTRSDKAVAGGHLGFLIELAPRIFDEADIANANKTFWESYILDPRSSAPTRQLGIKPSCNKCEGGAPVLRDYSTGQLAPLVDLRFDAVNALRVVGYLLDLKGHACPALWDRTRPMDLDYGPYDPEICKAL